MTVEERNERNRELARIRYRKKHPKVVSGLPTETNGLFMTEKISIPLPETETKEERAVKVADMAYEFQKAIHRQWLADRKPKSIITVEGGSKIGKGLAVYTVECVLRYPYDKELREYFKSMCCEKIAPASKECAREEKI